MPRCKKCGKPMIPTSLVVRQYSVNYRVFACDTKFEECGGTMTDRTELEEIGHADM